MNLLVWPAALNDAADGWDDQAEALNQALSSLNRVEASALGSRVAPSASTFLDTWRAQLKARVAEAEAHADALRASARSYQATDNATVARLQELLPWDQRELTPQPTFGPYGGSPYGGSPYTGGPYGGGPR
jgi:hypothetical protein